MSRATFLTLIQKYSKRSGDVRKDISGMTWIDLKLVLMSAFAPGTMKLVTPTRTTLQRHMEVRVAKLIHQTVTELLQCVVGGIVHVATITGFCDSCVVCL